MFRKNHLTSLLVSLLVAISLSACGGGGADIKSEINTTTVGQQLIDLKNAYDAGAMTQQEYEAQRTKVLNGT